MGAQSKPKKEMGFNYGDYLKWPENERWELIGGVPYNMTPAPSRTHQEILVALLNKFYNFLTDKECRVYVAPFDVRLPDGEEKEDEITTIVQPDLVVVCDQGKLDDKGCLGPPDLIVEITSPSTARKDLKEKFSLYERMGVNEYWIVNPTDEIIMVFSLDPQRQYGRPSVYAIEDTIQVGILDELSIPLKDIFKK
ncbi:MAG: Uma2 family endonuclease [Deltaproteobacteria bacterium]|nr:Uma2 family endonuclease [Deltaproteobacteria bacterium]